MEWTNDLFSDTPYSTDIYNPSTDNPSTDNPSNDNTSIEIAYQTSGNALFDNGPSIADELGWNNQPYMETGDFLDNNPTNESNNDKNETNDNDMNEININNDTFDNLDDFTSIDINSSSPITSNEIKQPGLEEIVPKHKLQAVNKPTEPIEFEVIVKNPEIQGEGVSSYVTYTVHTITSLDLYNNNEMFVKRRFSDFLWLHEQLIDNHKGIIIPPVPDKDLMKTNKISGNRFGQQFLEYRRRELERFLCRVTSHPILRISKVVQLFLETTDNSKFISAKDDEKQNKGGFFSRITKVVSLTSSNAEEIDTWFKEKTEYISNLKHNLEKLSVSAQGVNTYHANSINIHTPFMNSLKDMGDCESGNLGQSFKRISEIIAQLELFEHELTQNSGRAFVDVIGDYVRLTESVQRVLDWRLTKLADYQHAEKELQKLEAKKNPRLETHIQTARNKIQETKEIFTASSDLVRSEIEKFEETKAKEIQFAIVEFVQFNMNREICMRDLWKKFMSDME